MMRFFWLTCVAFAVTLSSAQARHDSGNAPATLLAAQEVAEDALLVSPLLLNTNLPWCQQLQRAHSSIRVICPAVNESVYNVSRLEFIMNWNPFPVGIAYPRSAEDVSVLLQFSSGFSKQGKKFSDASSNAKQSSHPIDISIRSGGHDNLGRSSVTDTSSSISLS